MRLRLIVFLVLAVISQTACFTKVTPGHAGIVVNNYGSQRGVKDYPVKTGAVWYNPFTEDVYVFPTYQQNYVWTKSPNEGRHADDESFTVQSIEGAGLNFDVSFSVSFEAESIPHLFVKYRQDPDHIISVYLRSVLRNSFTTYASKMKAADIYGAGRQALQDSVKADMIRQLKPNGIHLDQIAMIGEFRVDNLVKGSITNVLQASNAATSAEQKVRQVRAEADQNIAKARGDSASAVIRAIGEAHANEIILKSLSPGLIEYKTLERWDGVLPQVTGGGSPFISLKNRSEKEK